MLALEDGFAKEEVLVEALEFSLPLSIGFEAGLVGVGRYRHHESGVPQPHHVFPMGGGCRRRPCFLFCEDHYSVGAEFPDLFELHPWGGVVGHEVLYC